MKKYFLYASLVLGCVLGSGPFFECAAQDFSSASVKAKAIEALSQESGPDANGLKYAKGFLGYQIERWGMDETRIPACKQELMDSLKPILEKPKNFAFAMDLIFEELKKAEKDSRSKVVKFNAVLMAGELNSSQKRGEAVVPYAKARPFLKEKAASEEPAIRIAALKGLARHAESGIRSSEETADLAKLFASFAFAPLAKGEANESPEAQWARFISLEALGNLKTAGKSGEIAKGLFDSAARQNKALESPFFRRDMERRILAAAALAKINMDSAEVKAIGKKPDEIFMTLMKLFMQCMIYEYSNDYELQTGVEGEEMRNERMRQVARTLTPEEEAYQIRLWKQRTKAISETFNWIFSDKDSAVGKLAQGNLTYQKAARKVREISEMYDRTGLKKRSRPSRSADPEMPEIVEETSMISDDKPLSLYQMQRDMRTQLNELAEMLEITVNIPKKLKATTDMMY